jgi:methanogenic corrinoid protein MtbC1
MSEILEKIAFCIEQGKINIQSPYPPSMKGQEGADEHTRNALEQGLDVNQILMNGFIPGMERVGKKFRENIIFVPQVLMSAKAMSVAMAHLKPYFASGQIKTKGTFVIGTVMGDLHDIGKNLVAMILEGNGWKVVDLGTDVSAEKFLEAIKQHPGSVVGLSALLTTTMANMQHIVERIKAENPLTTIAIGGAPVNQEFCNKIGADIYSSDPQGLVESLHRVA